ncbi:MAG: hypothetical protein IJZ19_12285 [Lentisphaeria bacterium]|nr:hypothetical protein [Lentisphaeria bacterium]
MKKLLLFFAAAFTAVCSADFVLDFGKTKNPLDDLSFATNAPAVSKEKTTWNKGVLQVGGTWSHLYKAGETFTNGRATLSGYDRYKSSTALVARAKADFGAYYALEISTTQKKIRFYRYIFPKHTVIKEFPYDGGRAYTLDLDFNGKTIVPRVNGKALGEFPDDGKIKSGFVGARLGYWTNIHLLKLAANAKIPGEVKAAPAKPAAAKNAAAPAAEGAYVYNFSTEQDPFQELIPIHPTKDLLGKKVMWKNGIVEVKDTHAPLMTPKKFKTGRVTFAARNIYPNGLEFLAKARKDAGAFYAVSVAPREKKIVFSRFIYGDPKAAFKKEFPYYDGMDYTISVDFDGKNIVVWVNNKKIVTMPDDGKIREGYIGIRFGYWNKIQPLKVEYLPVIPEYPKEEPAAAAKYAKNIKTLAIQQIVNWDLSKAARWKNGSRQEISLNQFWAFQPVPTLQAQPKEEASEWGFFCVPGYWQKGISHNYMRDASGRAVTEWRGIPFTKGGVSAWYKRTFAVPANWKGQQVEMRLEDVSGTAEVFLNGRSVYKKPDHICDTLRFDIGKFLKYGAENEVRICSGSEIHGVSGMSNASILLTPAANLGDPAFVTKVSSGTLEIGLNGKNVPAGATVTLAVKDKDGNTLYTQKQPYRKTLSYKWMPPVLWTPDTPALYFAELTLKDRSGKTLDTTSNRFGFREFTAKNGKFYLNGNPITVKAETAVRNKAGRWGNDFLNDPEYMRPLFAMFKAVNLNCCYVPGPPTEAVLDLADEMGIMVLLKGPILPHAVMDKDFDKALKQLDALLLSMKKNPAYGRHPSQIAFLIDVWYGYNAGCTNPHTIGRPADDPNQQGIPAMRSERLGRIRQLYAKHFPAHECFTGGSGKVGNIYGTHVYHTWGAPSTELRALYEAWNKDPQYPIFVGETFLPYIGSFFDLENFHGGGFPYVTENTARILGPTGYNYRTTTISRPFHERSTKGWFWNSIERKEGGYYGFAVDSATNVIQKYIEEIMPGWRFHGLTGYGNFDYTEGCFALQNIDPRTFKFPTDYTAKGFKPDLCENGNARRPGNDPRVAGYDLRPTVLYPVFSHSMANVSAFIFDKLSDPLLQNHSGFSGETLEKSLMLLNETDKPLDFNVDFYLTDTQNRKRPVSTVAVTVKPFEKKLVPVSVKLPPTANRTEWVLHADISGAKKMHQTFPLQVFARTAAPELESAVSVYDPEGVLSKALEKRIRFTRLDSLNDLPKAGILIVGRGALSRLNTMPEWTKLAENGLNILVMEQKPDTSKELLKTRTRRVFCNAPAHPVFDGLQEADFSFWKDSHSIAPDRGKGGAGLNWSDWGNRNMVANYAFRRPQHGNWLSLLVSGFDLFQTPLLEYRSAKGSLISSQMEITERLDSDPAATRLFDNILRYLDRPAAENRVLFYGSAKGLLEKFGVKFEQVDTLAGDTLNNATLLILSAPDWEKLKEFRKELVNFVYFGGRVLYLHDGGSFVPSWLPFTMASGTAKATHANISGSADGLWLNGFGASEFYWRGEQKLPVFTNVPPHFEQTSPAVLVRSKFGSGEWIFTTLKPELFKESAAQGKTVRFLSALLTSAGAEIVNNSRPYAISDALAQVDLSEQKWEFATDKNNVGLKEKWHLGKGSGHWLKGLIADGLEVRVGQEFESFLRKDYDGYAWYRLTFDVPDEVLNFPTLYFIAGAIDDYDEVYLNGVKIGATGKETPKYWLANRNYRIPAGLLKKSGNLLAVRVFDVHGGGGIVEFPVAISPKKIEVSPRQWQTPYPNGVKRDYECKPDIVRMY